MEGRGGGGNSRNKGSEVGSNFMDGCEGTRAFVRRGHRSIQSSWDTTSWDAGPWKQVCSVTEK